MTTRFPMAALVLAALAACSSDSTGPTGLANALNADLATLVADGTAEQVDLMAGMNGSIGFPGFALVMDDEPPRGPGNVQGCGFGGGRFNCPPNRANGLTVEREVAFFDAGGAAQNAYDATTTAKIETDTHVFGEVARGPWSAEIDREHALVFTGLAGTETSRTVNGTGSETIARARVTGDGAERSYELSCTGTLVDVVVPVRAQGVTPWPLSGTATRNCTISRGDQAPVTRTVVVTFNGTATPGATVNGEAFDLNLANRRANRR